MVMIRTIIVFLALCCIVPAVYAQQPVGPEIAKPRDPRIRVIDFDPDQIYTVTGHTGYQMTIEFEPGEKIETVGIGDSSGWQVTPNGNATLLFLKPMGVIPDTNMSVVTNKRRYNLELSSRSATKANKNSIIHVLRFRLPVLPPVVTTALPNENLITPIPQDKWNRNYRFEGNKELVPEEIFDDGQYTFIRFAENLETPAIFAVSDAEDENLVNSNLRGKYLVIDRVSAQIVLRHGKLVTRLHNEAFVAATPGPDAPKQRPRKKRGFLGLGS
jgi:type IV secretion system protein VirB9